MTARAAGRPAGGSDSPHRSRRRFGIVDELNCYFDSPAEPNNVHLEAWLPGHLSPELLREAVSAVLAGLPRAGARRAAAAWWQSGYAWEYPPEADVDPVSVMGWSDEAELNGARARFLAAAPSLDRSPPFRLLLARGPGWDSLILNAHHAAFDGRSCLWLLSLIAGQYGGQPPLVPAADRAGLARPLPAPPSRSLPQAKRLPLRRTARIAPQQAGGHPSREMPGYGITLLGWPGVPAASRGGDESRVTVNDLLIAALIQTIAAWNAARHRRPGPVTITMPVDTRPYGHGDELGNLSRLCAVTVDPLRTADLTATVAGQTRQAKSQPSAPVSPAQAAVARARLPASAKRCLVRLAVRSLGRIECDTSLLSNLGNVADPPRFGPLSPTQLWFSTSAHMPRGLSLGAVTVDGRLQLCFRYRNALFDDAAGRDFAAKYAAALACLSELSEPAGTPGGGAGR